jgi:hypothetical protein
MQSPTSATIDRQILVIYRATENAVAALLPAPFRPRIFKDHAIVALSLVRLKPPKPRLMPSLITTQPEHIAHQIAVEWNHNGDTRAGWCILRRDTTARASLLGGNVVPGKLCHGRFHVHEQDGRFRIHCDSDDDRSHVKVDALTADFLPNTAIFKDVTEAAAFLAPATSLFAGKGEPMEVIPRESPYRAMAVWEAKSILFDAQAGAIQVDCGLLLRNVDCTITSVPMAVK